MPNTFTINWMDSNGSQGIKLHKPYLNNADGTLKFVNTNLSFRSGNYASYIDEINDESLLLRGYENINAITKLNMLDIVADNGYEIIIVDLKSEYCGVYVISSFNYTPISLDVFEYTLNLKYIREIGSVGICHLICYNTNGQICWGGY